MNWMEGLFALMKETLSQSVHERLGIAVAMTGVVLLCALFRNFDVGSKGGSVEKCAFFAEYTAIAVLLGENALYAKETAQVAMERMVTALNTVSPILLIASPGMGTTFLMATEVVANLFQTVFLPMTCIFAALSLVDNLSTSFSIHHLVELLKKIVFWGLGLVMTVYLGIMSVQSCLATAEGTTVHKTAKFAVGAWPVVGQYLAESFDVVSASASAMHTATGTGAMIAVLFACLAPALELLVLAGLLKLVSAVTQPVTESRICDCISSGANAISLMAGLVILCAVMLTITIAMFLTVMGRVKG